MNNFKITNLDISIAVKNAVKEQHKTVRACANAFNLRHSGEIKGKGWKKIDKDFVQRICSNQFSVVTPRVSNLCAFLKIDLGAQPTPERSVFTNEIAALDRVVQHNPDLEKTLRSLLLNVAEAFTLREAK
ncbi:hypothetical protein GCM10009007_08910 [Formosimonas limnophila]|uniref:Uncharacterized protein n=1 Tax=Formosimonas limnophila TaxID=1384487 RepID=A0A8J3CKS0_9BURK|nr:hypothetical protein [Formosimonas limnophila]GHA70390.1 hypothetical protein GCM10009007_08910 [Formosimonas limnophila]